MPQIRILGLEAGTRKTRFVGSLPAGEWHRRDLGQPRKRFDDVPLLMKSDYGQPAWVTIAEVNSAAALAANVQAGFHLLQMTVEDVVELLARRKGSQSSLRNSPGLMARCP